MYESETGYIIVNDKRFKKFIDEIRIKSEVIRLSHAINQDYQDKKVLFIIVLKGSIFFASDLLRNINLECEVETVRASSYGNEMKNSELILSIGNIDVKDKNVIIIEDIVETGNTVYELMQRLNTQEPASLEIVSFLYKPAKREKRFNIKYVGIEIPPDFVIGYGLDYAELGRQLPDIYVLN